MKPLFEIPHRRNMKKSPAIDETPVESFRANLKKHKISSDEYQLLKESLRRTPTLTELGIFSAMWSEHCSYKSSRVHLKRFPTKGENVVVGPGENAGVVRLSEKLCLAFKMESHNHPSFIEPFHGSATGVGGILRDVFCMGARPIANLNCLRFGEKNLEKTKWLLPRVIDGISHYGNCIGVPTVGGNVSFDGHYNGNCLVNAMTVGIIHEDKIFKGFASGVGNLVVYVGSATGRDGIHGATMASDQFSSQSTEAKNTIQVGDPFMGKLLLEATLEVLEKELVVGIQDMGAAGLTSSAFEMAGRAGNGLFLNLDLVPTRTSEMTPYELMLSESQERMLMVIEPKKWVELQDVLEKWQLSFAIIGIVTDTARVEVFQNQTIFADVPVNSVTDRAPMYKRPIKISKKKFSAEAKGHFNDAFLSHSEEQLLQRMLERDIPPGDFYNQYDRHIGLRTVLTSDDGGAAVLWIHSDATSQKNIGVAISTACNEFYCAADSKLGAAHAVLKCAREITAAGGIPLAITDCLNFGNPEHPETMGDFSEAVDGISLACTQLNTPVVSGNVSLYNETDGNSIFPTPMIGMVGKVSDVACAVSAKGQKDKDIYVLTGANNGIAYDWGATYLGKTFSDNMATQPFGLPPEIQWKQELSAMQMIQNWTQDKALASCRDVGRGGIYLTLYKMFEGAKFNWDVSLLQMNDNLRKEFLFAETGFTYIVQFNKKITEMDVSQFELRLFRIGCVGAVEL